NLHRLHHARLPGQVHALHGRAARSPGVVDHEQRDRRGDPPPARHHAADGRPGTPVAAEGPRTADRLSSALELTDTMTTTPEKDSQLVEMAWDPIPRIVGSLGIYAKIDFAERRVAECYSTSSIFRGYSVFMKGKDPRDAHFITSRICGICG